MLKFFLRLYLLLTLGFAASLLLIDKAANAYFAPYVEQFNREAVRGQLYSLQQEFEQRAPSQREAFRRELQPHYGLSLSLVDADTFPASADERAELRAGRFVPRDEFAEYLVPLAGEGKPQWLRVVLPQEPALSDVLLFGVYLALAVMVGMVLFIWVKPMWHDLQALKLAAQQVGEGQLGARARVSKRSSIRDLARHFNQMSERIGRLISSQRDLTNALSHEIRTPLARLSFELDILRREGDPVARLALIEEMVGDVRELDDMATELLAYARLEHRGTALTVAPVELRAWLESLVEQVALEASARGVECVVVSCPDGQAEFDARVMSRATINLLRNAIRYAGRRVELRIAACADGYVLHVDDDGPGIPAEARDRVFEPFTRLDESRDRTTGGFGLGLAIVQRAAQWHGGQVVVTASALGGASFALSWPACPGALHD